MYEEFLNRAINEFTVHPRVYTSGGLILSFGFSCIYLACKGLAYEQTKPRINTRTTSSNLENKTETPSA